LLKRAETFYEMALFIHIERKGLNFFLQMFPSKLYTIWYRLILTSGLIPTFPILVMFAVSRSLTFDIYKTETWWVYRSEERHGHYLDSRYIYNTKLPYLTIFAH
jgi:hypothetical protein